MKKAVIYLILVLCFAHGYSQDRFVKLPIVKSGCVTVLISDDIIANTTILETNKDMVSSLSVFTEKPTREHQKFYNLSAYGVVLAVLNKKIKYKTQKEIRRFFGFDTTNRIYVNGYLLEHPDYKIAMESIIDIEIIEPNIENELDHKAINVWTLTVEQRLRGCQN